MRGGGFGGRSVPGAGALRSLLPAEGRNLELKEGLRLPSRVRACLGSRREPGVRVFGQGLQGREDGAFVCAAFIRGAEAALWLERVPWERGAARVSRALPGE